MFCSYFSIADKAYRRATLGRRELWEPIGNTTRNASHRRFWLYGGRKGNGGVRDKGERESTGNPLVIRHEMLHSFALLCVEEEREVGEEMVLGVGEKESHGNPLIIRHEMLHSFAAWRKKGR